jgi:oligopeptide/dipeptide ABC transporter ATP-binding protein
MNQSPALNVQGLCVEGPRGLTILDRFEMVLRAGEIMALVGETGSGKPTVLNSILGLLPSGLHVTSGSVEIEENGPVDLLDLEPAERRRYLGVRFGYVPQDARSGLNPLMTARQTVLEAARRVPGRARERSDAALIRAGLSEEFARNDADRRPGRLSGGQCQRVLIAQAIVNNPQVLLLDEPTASLDPRARTAVRDTLRRLADDRCAVCLVTHDIAALPGLADRIGVLYLGRIVEAGPAAEVLGQPLHPYTRGLLACLPRLDRREPLRPIPGETPTNANQVSGCAFHPRCELVEEQCRTQGPALRTVDASRKVACHVVGSDAR